MKDRRHPSRVIIPVILALNLLLSLFTGCATTAASSAENAETENTLNELEWLLYDNLIKISDDFYNPASIKLLDVVAYSMGSEAAEEGSELQCSDIVLVRLQGENRTGGKISNYYVICLKENEMGKTLSDYAALKRTYDPAKDLLMGFDGKEGEYYNVGVTEPTLDTASVLETWNVYNYFNVKNINTKLDEYWANKGF